MLIRCHKTKLHTSVMCEGGRICSQSQRCIGFSLGLDLKTAERKKEDNQKQHVGELWRGELIPNRGV